MLARFNTAAAVKYGLKEAVLFEHIVDRIRYADLWDEPEASDDCARIAR